MKAPDRIVVEALVKAPVKTLDKTAPEVSEMALKVLDAVKVLEMTLKAPEKAMEFFEMALVVQKEELEAFVEAVASLEGLQKALKDFADTAESQ